MADNLAKVFVYGTLKRGQPNHHWLSDTANGYQKFLGIAQTSKSFPLVVASRYNIPYLLDKEGSGNRVEGEVYEVDEQMLSRLDVLEDHPKYYTRRVEEVQLENDSTALKVWIYLFPKIILVMLCRHDPLMVFLHDDISDPEEVD